MERRSRHATVMFPLFLTGACDQVPQVSSSSTSAPGRLQPGPAETSPLNGFVRVFLSWEQK